MKALGCLGYFSAFHSISNISSILSVIKLSVLKKINPPLKCICIGKHRPATNMKQTYQNFGFDVSKINNAKSHLIRDREDKDYSPFSL